MRTLAVVAISLAGLALAACNTVAGAGRDLSSAGRAVTQTADDVRR
jgi:predicted small secreted protein